MNFYSGNYFCTKSNWDGELYDANNLVAIERYDDYGDIDFKSLLNVKKIFDKNRYSMNPRAANGADWKSLCTKDSYSLKPEVHKWLIDTVKDDKFGGKGWCVGNDEYTSKDSMSFSLFFYRRKDALNFIKTWSYYKKPTETYNQHTYVKKKLNLKTNKLEVEKD